MMAAPYRGCQVQIQKSVVQMDSKQDATDGDKAKEIGDRNTELP